MSSFYEFLRSMPQPSLLVQSQQAPKAPSQNQNQHSKVVTFSKMRTQIFVEAPQANHAVHFYKAAFGAEEVNRVSQWRMVAGQELLLVISAELRLGSTTFIVSDVTKNDQLCYAVMKSKMQNTFCLETEDIDAAVEKAIKAGAITQGEIAKPNGGRARKVMDPYGNIWMICSSAAAM